VAVAQPAAAAAPAGHSSQPQEQQQQQQQPGALNAEKKRKILQQFDELQQAYISSRLRRSSGGGGPEQQQLDQQQQQLGTALGSAAAAGGAGVGVIVGTNADTSAAGNAAAAAAAAAASAAAAAVVGANDEGAAGLDAFSEVLSAVTHFNSLSTLAYIPPSTGSAAAAAARSAAGTSSSSACNILSSLEFDCKGQLFAAAGVQQRICVYDYQAVLAAAGAGGSADTTLQQQQQSTPAAAAAAVQPSLEPLLDLPTQHKISCTSFSSAVQQYLLSSDYEGLVHLWDLNSAKIVRRWEAHERRIWVVDSCGLQPDQFATGSDDGTVKVRAEVLLLVSSLGMQLLRNMCGVVAVMDGSPDSRDDGCSQMKTACRGQVAMALPLCFQGDIICICGIAQLSSSVNQHRASCASQPCLAQY
jgi:hypothetical protein